MNRLRASSRLVFAADLPALESIRILEKIRLFVDLIKIPPYLLVDDEFSSLIDFARQSNIPLFFDLKIADVPHTNAVIVRTAKSLGASVVSVHGFVGVDGIVACLDAAQDEIKILVQLELTSPGAELFNTNITLEMAQIVCGLGITAVQAPGNRAERVREIRNIVGPYTDIVCCGVGVQGGSFAQVISAGADFAIVGRAIYKAEDPVAAVRGILNCGEAINQPLPPAT